MITQKILAFNGSPRKEGNTSLLIKSVFEELNKSEIETELIHVGKKQLQGCIACMKCWENKDGHCAMGNDSVNEYLDKIKESDGLILGSPVYCASLSAQIKAFMDRVSMVSCANDHMLKRKVGAAVVAVRRAGAVFTFNTMNNFFTILQMVVVSSSYWNMGYCMDEGEVLKDTEGMQTMRNLGRNMAWILKSIKAGKEKGIQEPETKVEVLMNFIR